MCELVDLKELSYISDWTDDSDWTCDSSCDEFYEIDPLFHFNESSGPFDYGCHTLDISNDEIYNDKVAIMYQIIHGNPPNTFDENDDTNYRTELFTRFIDLKIIPVSIKQWNKLNIEEVNERILLNYSDTHKIFTQEVWNIITEQIKIYFK